jgi:hypothetical protein
MPLWKPDHGGGLARRGEQGKSRRRAAPKDRMMIELIRTNDAVLISFVESLMRDAGIGFFVADQNMSVVEGSLGILPRRVMVERDREAEARRILTDAGISNEIKGR